MPCRPTLDAIKALWASERGQSLYAVPKHVLDELDALIRADALVCPECGEPMQCGGWCHRDPPRDW